MKIYFRPQRDLNEYWLVVKTDAYGNLYTKDLMMIHNDQDRFIELVRNRCYVVKIKKIKNPLDYFYDTSVGNYVFDIREKNWMKYNAMNRIWVPVSDFYHENIL